MTEMGWLGLEQWYSTSGAYRVLSTISENEALMPPTKLCAARESRTWIIASIRKSLLGGRVGSHGDNLQSRSSLLAGNQAITFIIR
jgi:hypothetical protein